MSLNCLQGSGTANSRSHVVLDTCFFPCNFQKAQQIFSGYCMKKNISRNRLQQTYKTPAQAGSVLVAGKKVDALSLAMQKKYCSGTGKAMHAVQYSKPETYNAVQDLSQHMHEATKDLYKAMLRVLKYSVNTADQGLVLKPNRKLDGSQNHKFVISGRSDSDYAKQPKDRCSISGHMVYLKGAPAMFKSSTERMVSLSLTEAETYAGVTCVQDML
jgi:hypothetical protein